MEAYTAFVLSDESRSLLLKKFPPKYPDVIAHHVTVQFGVIPKTSPPPAPESIKVVGYKDSGDGLEALVVAVNGTRERPDGSTYHITWSLDRSKYKPVDSNKLLSKGTFTIIKPIEIQVVPLTLV